MTTDSVPANQLGEITKLPGLGTRFIRLWEFHREGLARLERTFPFESHMHNNRRLRDHALPMQNWVPRSPVCDSCSRSFRELGGGAPLTSRNTTYNLVMVTPNHNHREARHFCWGCAASREKLIIVCGTPFAESIAEDGNDVFAFIAQTIYEDKLSDELPQPSLQCHHRGNARIMAKYRRTIGGRLLSLQERGLFSGPVHPRHLDPIEVFSYQKGPSSAEISARSTSAEVAATSELKAPDSTRVHPPLDDPEDQLERQQRVATVILRPKQHQFRTALLEAYGGRCAITGCSAPLALQAAHIIPVSKEGTDSARNGILLRADLHLLFDAGLITIDHRSMTVEVAPALAGTEYEILDTRSVCIPQDATLHPSAFGLERHRMDARRDWSN